MHKQRDRSDYITTRLFMVSDDKYSDCVLSSKAVHLHSELLETVPITCICKCKSNNQDTSLQ